jgi:hypothetical protein
MKIYGKRLLKGLIYTGLSLFVIFHEFGTNFLGAKEKWMPMISHWAENQSTFVYGLTKFLMFVAIVAALVYLVKGIYFLCTMHIQKNGVFEVPLSVMFSKPVSGFEGQGNGIDRMKQYRNAKMSTMTNAEGAEEYKKTAWVDGLTSDN